MNSFLLLVDCVSHQTRSPGSKSNKFYRATYSEDICFEQSCELKQNGSVTCFMSFYIQNDVYLVVICVFLLNMLWLILPFILIRYFTATM
jgi:hypothetical protein